MHRRSLFHLFIAILLLSIVAFSSPAQARLAVIEPASETHPATLPWFTGWADKTTSDGVGGYPSIAYNPVDGFPYISYYDSINENLMLASPYPYGGSNCGKDGDWWCRVVDGDGLDERSEGDMGEYSSIAFWSGILGWKLGISYHDDTNNALKFAEWNNPFFGNGYWTFDTVDTSNLNFLAVGLYTSLKYSSDGTPRIAYYDSSAISNDSLLYAYKVDDGGNCGEGEAAGKWQCDVVDSGDQVGMYASLDIDYLGSGYVAYYDGGNSNLKLAVLNSIGSCGDGYICTTIDGEFEDVGLSSVVIANKSGVEQTRIAYYDREHGELKVATSGAYGEGSCNPNNDWECLAVDDIGLNQDHVGISMALDQQGYLIIAYEDATDLQGNTQLKVARPVFALGLDHGNCGDVPPGYLFKVWQCETIDDAWYGQGYVNVADFTSVAVGPNGLATIAYMEKNSYNLSSALKIAYQRFQIFLPTLLK